MTVPTACTEFSVGANLLDKLLHRQQYIFTEVLVNLHKFALQVA